MTSPDRLPYVEAELNYLVPPAERPRYYAYEPGPGDPPPNMVHEPHTMHIVDVHRVRLVHHVGRRIAGTGLIGVIARPLGRWNEVVQLGFDIRQAIGTCHAGILLSIAGPRSRKTGSADNRGDRVGPRRATVPARISLRPRVCREPALPGSRCGAKPRRCEACSSLPPERLVAQGRSIGPRDADIGKHAVVHAAELLALTHPAAPQAQRRKKRLGGIAQIVER